MAPPPFADITATSSSGLTLAVMTATAYKTLSSLAIYSRELQIDEVVCALVWSSGCNKMENVLPIPPYASESRERRNNVDKMMQACILRSPLPCPQRGGSIWNSSRGAINSQATIHCWIRALFGEQLSRLSRRGFWRTKQCM